MKDQTKFPSLKQWAQYQYNNVTKKGYDTTFDGVEYSISPSWIDGVFNGYSLMWWLPNIGWTAHVNGFPSPTSAVNHAAETHNENRTQKLF